MKGKIIGLDIETKTVTVMLADLPGELPLGANVEVKYNG